MHHLRKKRALPGDIRPGILGLVALAAIAGVLVSCAPRGAGKGTAPGASWFQLTSTIFQTVGAPDASPPVPALPWTVQSRVTDMTFLGDTLYCAVNGAGLAAVEADASGALRFTYHYDAPIFAHRTITTIIPRHGDLMVHLYYNALLNDVRPEDLLLRGISLVTFLPGQKDFSFIIPPFQRKNPEWEAVGFAPISENEFDFEWKYTDATETRFSYTRFRADLQVEAESNRDAYVAALGTPALSGSDVPASYSELFQACRSRMPGLPAGTALHFKVRSRQLPVQRYFRSGLDQDSILVIHVFDDAGTLSAFLPDGQVVEKSAGSEMKSLSLPALPAGYTYTDFVKEGGLFIVSWEEAQFTQVGRAGVVAFRRPE